MQLRRYRPGDATGGAEVFYRAVREGAASAYDAAQRAAWAPEFPRPPEMQAAWATRLGMQITWVAEEAGVLQGLFSLRTDGYLDLAFVLPARMGTGLAGQLYDRIEAEAQALGLRRLTVEASRLARPFLARRGWQVDAAQEVVRHGVTLPNFRMSKALG